MYRKYFKRFFDFTSALAAIILLSPLLVILALVVRFKLGSPIIFKQERPGLNEKLFTIYKFRSMVDKRDASGKLLPDDERLTRFGKLLRSSSLDELPSLFNILNGDMSVVGPRPLLVEYLDLYDDEQKKRHNIRPGLTGLAQIAGRNQATWTTRLELDLEYIEEMNILLDIKILLVTIKKVFVREGIEYNGQTKTIYESLGKNNEKARKE